MEFPELTGKIAFHIPDEKDKRHGQAVAAASLPAILPKVATEFMTPYHQLVSDYARLLKQGRSFPLGTFKPAPRPEIPPNAPKALFFAPHPDDECIVGGMAVRLMRQARMNLINVAVTLGSKKERQQERLRELQNACNYLGFSLVPTAPNGLEKDQSQDPRAGPEALGGLRQSHQGHHRASTSRRWCCARTTATGTARTSAPITW